MAINDSYKDRMKAEYFELKDRTKKLGNVVLKYEAGTLDFEPDCPIHILKEQLYHMTEYLYILRLRGEIEGVLLEEM